MNKISQQRKRKNSLRDVQNSSQEFRTIFSTHLLLLHYIDQFDQQFWADCQNPVLTMIIDTRHWPVNCWCCLEMNEQFNKASCPWRMNDQFSEGRTYLSILNSWVTDWIGSSLRVVILDDDEKGSDGRETASENSSARTRSLSHEIGSAW
jgi:hypothetical protein